MVTNLCTIISGDLSLGPYSDTDEVQVKITISEGRLVSRVARAVERVATESKVKNMVLDRRAS